MRPRRMTARLRCAFLRVFVLFSLTAILVVPGLAQGFPCPRRIVPICSYPSGDTARCLLQLRSTDGTAGGSPVTLTFLRDGSYDVNRERVGLAEGSSEEIEVTVHRTESNPGLVHLEAQVAPWPPECPALDLPVDFGLSGAGVRVQVPKDGDGSLAFPLEVGKEQSFLVQVVNPRNQPQRFPVPLTVSLRTLNDTATVSTDFKTFKAEATTTLGEGRDSTDPILIRPSRPGPGDLMLDLKLDSSRGALTSTKHTFATQYQGWQRVGVAAAGGLLYWLLTWAEHLAKARRGRSFWRDEVPNIASSLLASILGYTLIEVTGSFGIKLDPTQLMGYLVLGLLLACLGVDGLLQRLKDFVGGKPRE